MLCSLARPALAGLAVSLAFAAVARADLVGFGDYTTDWRFQRLDSAPNFSPVGNGLRLSSATGAEQYRNYFNVNRQGVSQFVASFTYRNTPQALGGSGWGLALTLFTNATASDGSLTGGNVGAFGFAPYSGFQPSANFLNPSVGFVMRLPTGVLPASGFGVYTNNRIGGTIPSTGPINFASGQDIDVQIRYNQAGDLRNFIYTTFTNRVTGATFASDPTFLDIPATLNAQTAFVGFTTQAFGEQVISNFSFVAVPSPSAAALLGLSALAAARRRRA